MMSQFLSTRVALLGAALVFLTVILISLFLPSLTGGLSILLVGILYLGIPHGALDIYLIQKIVRRKRDIILLLTFYVVALFPMSLAWKFSPTGAFLFFVLYSSFHFAQSDLVFAKFNHLEFWTRFLSIFSFPFTFHTDKFLKYASYLLADDLFKQFISVFQFGTILAILGILIISLLSFKEFVKHRAITSTQFMEHIVILILYYFLDPLYAFGIYFCFIHSIKHLVNVFSSDIKFSVIEILPFWLIPISAMAGIVVFSQSINNELLMDKTFLHSTMIVISAIALPHAVLVHFCKKTNMIK